MATVLSEQIQATDAASDLPKGKWLNIGSGPNNPRDWINIDGSMQAWFANNQWLAKLAALFLRRQVGRWPRGIVYRDVRKPLGFREDEVAVVYSSHTLEHLHRNEALKLLTGVHRMLMPGGVCRIVVPDVSAIVTWYLEHCDLPAGQKQQPSSDMLMEMLVVRQLNAPRLRGPLDWYRCWTSFDEHKWMYDGEGLGKLFLEAGFKNPRECGYLKSVIPAQSLSLVEQASRIEHGAGVCIEAIKQ